jgi:NADH-quinone oxidoreductase subunit M
MSPIVFLMLIMGFGCHSALWPFHTWAPDGHGSAPTAGSIIFAGVLMKIGLIGFIKIIIPLMPNMVAEYKELIIILASINVLYGALTAMRQDDLKYMAAYASLSHIGYIFIALMTSNSTGINGGLIQIVSHGLIICLLFFCVGSIHKLKGTRSIKELNSMLDNSPILSYFFIFTAFASIGFPLTSGFIAEFLIINGIHEFSYNSAYMILILFVPITGIFFTTIYMFRAVKNCCLRFNENAKSTTDFSRHEVVICLVLVTVIVTIGVFPSLIQDLLGNSYERLVLR